MAEDDASEVIACILDSDQFTEPGFFTELRMWQSGWGAEERKEIRVHGWR